MGGQTWKDLARPAADEIRSYLLENGGSPVAAKNAHEVWRIKYSDSAFTYYDTGTLYSTPSSSNDPAILEARRHIDSLVGPTYVLPTKDFLIGLDETGKGELIGHTILAGVVFPKELFEEIAGLTGPADTKKSHTFEYWDSIFKNLDSLRGRGLNFIIQKVPPWHVDRYNLNKLMDLSYQNIISRFLREAEIPRCRVVFDDYGVGATLRRFLNVLERYGAEVVVSTHSEDRYLEAKTASLVSKREREAVMKAINQNGEWQVDGLSVGSGNAGDGRTLAWLMKWHASGRKWPWFVKRSFTTVAKIDGRGGTALKLTPPIRNELLSDEFVREFNEGKLSIQSLRLVCPNCGNLLKSTTFATFKKDDWLVSTLKCPYCSSFIKDAGITLRYYCGYVVPDSSAIQRSLIGNDLAASKFFENFTVILVPVVRKECDGTPTGKRQFDQLRKYSDMGRIRLEVVGNVEELPGSLSSTVRDERIIQDCLKFNAILITADHSMGSFAVGKNVFSIVV